MCNHCYHPTGILLCSFPPKQEQVCCYCGYKHYLMIQRIMASGEHGPFLPKELLGSRGVTEAVGDDAKVQE